MYDRPRAAISWAAIEPTVLEGIAKPTPSFPPESLWICAVIPITWPEESMSGPPELPWLIAASVWITPPIVKLFGELIDPVERAHDPARHRLGKPEGASDRDHRVTDGNRAGVPERERVEERGRRRDAHDREVGRLVGPDELCREAAAVPEHHADRGRPEDDVIVGEDIALGVVDEARALGGLGAAAEAEARRGSPGSRGDVRSTTPW